MQALRVTLALAVADLRGQMQYRANFLIQIVVGMVWQCTGFLFLWVVLSRFQALAGWTLGSVAFLYALRLAAHAFESIFFLPLENLGWQVRSGEVDRYLVRPVPVLLQLLSAHRSLVMIGDILSAVVLFVAATRLVAIHWSPLAVLYLGLSVLGGCLVEAALALIASSLAFRFLNADALGYFVDSFFATFGNYPLTLYGGVLRWILTVAPPLAFVAYVPATVLLGRTGELSIPVSVAYLAPLVGVAWFALAYRFFVHELRYYQSAGH